jgi:hypothetical protein
MTKCKWTPGKWFKSGDATVRAHRDIAYLARNTMPDSELRANAALIAAAADLYEALESAMHELAGNGYRDEDGPMPKIMDAFAKARGEAK